MTVPAGQAFRIVDVEGNQVADLFAFNAADVSEYPQRHAHPRGRQPPVSAGRARRS